MKIWKKLLFALAFIVFATFSGGKETAYASDGIAYGADVGWLNQLENEGITWVDDNGVQKDVLELLKDKGIDSVRIRAFVKPSSDFRWTKPDGSTCLLGYADTNGVVYTAKRAKDLGMKVLIVFHYSDHFADPMYQDVPAEWADASAEQLEQYVYDYTYYVMSRLKEEGIYPEWVQVGNELTSGMLLPMGSSTDNFQQLAKYLNSGYDAVKAVSPATKVVTHLANGNETASFTWFLDQFLNTYNGKTDVIGMSYYPRWIGDNEIENMTYNLNNIAMMYDKEVMVCETGGHQNEEEETYELLRQEINALKSVANNKGVGIFYWEPEANSSIMPDRYPLGATRVVRDNVLQFTTALDAFKEEPKFLSSETSFEILNYNSQKALNVMSGSQNNSAVVEQYGYDEWDSQKWYFEEVENGYYKITNKNSGKVLEVDGLSIEEGASCTQYEYNGGWNQMWKVVSTSDGKYKLQNRLSGLYLSVADGSLNDGSFCVQLSDDDSNNVKWLFLVTE